MNFDTLERLTPDAAARTLEVDALAAPFADLAAALTTASSGKKIVLLQNNGNFGDALIRYGTLKFFEDYDIAFENCDMAGRAGHFKALALGVTARFLDPALFIVSGSGAWADVCMVARKFTLRQFKVNPSLFVMPSTFQYYGLPDSVPVFARDKGESARRVPHARFCHDMAFYLALIHPDRVLPNRVPPTRKLGIMFRTDNEARDHGLAGLPGNHDLSAQGTHLSDPQDFLRYLDQFEAVLTDRLHIAIGACVLGKTVHILPGNYFKIRDIYQASIDGIFPNCTLISDARAADLARRYAG
jgi:hypothetical protein